MSFPRKILALDLHWQDVNEIASKFGTSKSTCLSQLGMINGANYVYLGAFSTISKHSNRLG